ncbi:MAG: tyrosine-type recombinase/integrase, partial [Novosphingobium sp.]|nr:tyrosine-type recombinase/integrase [Novosphingobium sp.]
SAPKKITAGALKTLAKGQTLWDGELKGFGARRQGEAVTFFLKCRHRGRQRWITIGRMGSPWSLVDARGEALRLMGEVARGAEPVAVGKTKDGELTVCGLVELFLDRHAPKLKPNTRGQYTRACRKVLVPKLGKRLVTDDLRAATAKLHAELQATPALANQVLAVFSKLMSWAEDNGFRAEGDPNPCRKVGKYVEQRKERYLSGTELERLGKVLAEREQSGAESPFVIAAIRLLLLTGARLQEILTLKWSYVDLDRALLFLPDSKTGKKVVRLNQAAVAVLAAVPRVTGNAHVIVGALGGAHLVNLQKPWRRIRKKAGLDDVRLHDLRHSFASIGAEVGGSLPMIGKLLGHSQPRTTQRYAHLEDRVVDRLNNQVGQAIWQRLGGTAAPSATTPQAEDANNS